VSLLTALIVRAVRFLVPEGVLVLALLGLPTLTLFEGLAPYTTLLLSGVLVAAIGLGWRFRRGQLLFGAAILALAALLPLLPPGARAPALALVTLNMALLAVLPERGIVSLGGTVAALLLLAQGLLLTPLAPFTLVAPPPLALPTLPPVSLLWVAHAAGLATLASLALLRSDALPRGLFWATAALLAGTAVPGADLWSVVVALAALLVSAVEEAHRLAYHDGLTGLPSRRALDERLERLVGRYTLAMVDVDHFKQFNDRHGHDVGDQVLRLVATRLAATPGARAYRYGGEEFALVFRGRSLRDALETLDGARRAIAERPFVVRGADRPARKPKRRLFLWRDRPTLSVTVSLGAAERTGWRQSPGDVVKAADQALYRAKEKGRNRVVAA